MDAKTFLEILHTAERLKDTTRHCTTTNRRQESVAEHSWRISLMAMLLRQYRLLQHVKIMLYEKKSRDYIREAMGLSPYVAEQYMRQASAYTGGQVRKAAALCLETEVAFKSGRVSPDSALEALLIKLLSLRQKD